MLDKFTDPMLCECISHMRLRALLNAKVELEKCINPKLSGECARIKAVYVKLFDEMNSAIRKEADYLTKISQYNFSSREENHN